MYGVMSSKGRSRRANNYTDALIMNRKFLTERGCIVGGFLCAPIAETSRDQYVFDEDDLIRHTKRNTNAKDILRSKIEHVATGTNATKFMGEMMKDLGEKIRGQFKKIKDSNRSLSKEFCSQLIKKLDKEETANATKAQEAVSKYAPPQFTETALMPANVKGGEESNQ